jgi:sulfite exporter TauE/SafE
VDKTSRSRTFLGSFLYHIGRLLSYGLIGVLFGLLGRGLYLAGFQQRLSILIGVAMILIVLIPARHLNRFAISRPLYRMIGQVKSKLGLYLNKTSYKALFLIGFFNGFLPCGLVYMALLGSVSTGSAVEGALYMIVFGLGTVPLMTAAIYLGNFLKISVRKRIQRAIPIFVVIIGICSFYVAWGSAFPTFHHRTQS